ncbi:hypothetical protein E6W39_21790 [Kitasatospora acidiphila]|uniref:Uncharacterized protein n=1 Tax=Kitasatospora acidiphila TaxID=2567942 RepID=A0A540W5S5_9ACTN|nr:hypothetical protein [Kitasatospora acidiphila]TQF04372.1 hypothetical protein E6W39_21790 [Kitasatospora acidiphila]
MSIAPSSPSAYQAAALAELRSLGRSLDRQVAEGTAVTEHEVDAMLRLMRQVHTGIVVSHGDSTVARAA